MNGFIKIGIILWMTTGLFGCASVEAPVPEPIMATITLIRIEAEPTAPSVQVLVKNEIVAVINNRSTATFDLPIGTQLLTFNWPDTPITFDDEITVELEEDDHKYISIMHRFEIPEIANNGESIDYTMMETLAAFELPGAFARSVILNLINDPSREGAFEVQ